MLQVPRHAAESQGFGKWLLLMAHIEENRMSKSIYQIEIILDSIAGCPHTQAGSGVAYDSTTMRLNMSQSQHLVSELCTRPKP